MARGQPRGFRCRILKKSKRQCRKRGRKVQVVGTLKPNKRTLIRLCRLKAGLRNQRTGKRRRGRTAAFEICKKR